MAENECLFKALYACQDGNLCQSSRIATILAASNVRQDDIHLRTELSDGSQIVRCHKNCISKYVSPSTLDKLRKRMTYDQKTDESAVGPKRLRSNTEGVFVFEKHCLFCYDVSPCILPHEYDKKVPSQYRVASSIVTTDQMGDGRTYKEYLLNLCQIHGGELGKIVSDRILGAPSDLHAVDARYHRKCNASFHIGANRACDTDKNGAADDQALSETIHALSCDRSKIWNSLDVEAVYSDKGGCVLSRRILVERVAHHFGKEMLSLNSPGVATLLVFRKHAAAYLSLADDDQNDGIDECVQKVGMCIMKETKAAKPNLKSYDKHINCEVASECISDTLLKLMSVINPKHKTPQTIMVGNIVSSMVTCQPTPLQIAFGILLGDHKMLITELYKYGICCSYDEVRRFRRSAAVQSSKAKLLSVLRDASVSNHC